MNDRSELYRNLGIAVVVAAVAVLKWDFFKNFLIFGATLGVLVAIHEWGHYIAAKAVGARVYEFAIGMGPKLITYMRRQETEYTLRAFPIGGFVNIKGMQPDDEITEDGLNGKRPAERALVYLAGPLMNVVFGVMMVLLMGILFGTPDPTNVLVGEVKAKKPASLMKIVSVNGQTASRPEKGLRVGDRVLAVNGTEVEDRSDISDLIHPLIGQTVTLKVRRKQETLELLGVTEKSEQPFDDAIVTSVPKETALALQPGDVIRRINGKYPPLLAPKAESLTEAIQTVLTQNAGKPVTITLWRNLNTPLTINGPAGPVEMAMKSGTRTVGVLGFMPIEGAGPRVGLQESLDQGARGLRNFALTLTGMASKPKVLSENVGGPVKIFEVLGQSLELAPLHYAGQLASLSLSLAVFNLIPIPVLDGGHMLILTVEVLRRKRLSAESQKVALMVGLAIIGVIFVLILQKDLSKFF